MADVKLPLLGGVSKKALAIGGVSAAAVVGLFLLRKRGSAAPAAAAGQDPNAIDPATGLTYAEEAAGATGDYLSPGLQDTTGGPTYGSTGYVDPNTGQWVYGNTGTGQAAATTNAQWAQNAIAYLSQNSGTDPGTLGAALGAYLAGRAVTADQEGLIDQAIAVEGYPPTAGASGYPPGIRTSDTGTGAGGTAGSGGGVTGSGSGGTGTGTGTGTGRLAAPSGFRLTIDGKTGVRLQWDSVPHAMGYVAQCKQGGANGTTVNGPFRVTEPVANFGGLKTKTAYTALIWPSSQADPGGPGSNQPHAQYGFKTT